MAAFNKFQQFVEDLAKGVHNLDTGVLKIMLTNTAPVATNSVKADLTEISAGNGYTAGGAAVANQDAEHTTGTLKLIGDDLVITAAGGVIGPFRYAVLYNDTPSSPADPLIGWWEYPGGASISLQDGESITVDISAANGILQIT